MTIAKSITKTLDISVEDVRIDLTATIRSYDLTDTQFVFEIKSSNGMTVNLTGSTAMFIVEYVHNSQTYAIQGNIDIIGTDTLSFNLPEDLKGYSGTVLIGIYVKLTDGTKIDIKDIAVRIEPSIMDKDIDFSAKTYFKDFESIKAEVILEGEKAKTSIKQVLPSVQSAGETAKTNINAVVSDVNDYADSQKQAIHSIVDDVQSTGDTAKADINATLPTLQDKISELSESITEIESYVSAYETYRNTSNKNANAQFYGLYFEEPTYIKSYMPEMVQESGSYEWALVESSSDTVKDITATAQILKSGVNPIGTPINVDYEMTEKNALVVCGYAVGTTLKYGQNLSGNYGKFLCVATSSLNNMRLGQSKFIASGFSAYNVSGEIVVGGKTQFYKKSETYNKKEINALLSGGILAGKNLLVIGDSMVQGNDLPSTITWSAKIANRNGMTVVNKGYNGCYLSNYDVLGVQSSVYSRVCDSNAYFYIPDSIITNSDYIILFCGTNDISKDKPIGVPESTDVTTVYGALKEILNTLQTRNPRAKIGFITPYKRRNIEQKCQNYIDAIMSVCADYNIPVFDNSKNGGINWNNDAIVTTLAESDTLHLNEDGHEWVSYKYESFIRSL